MPNMKCPGLPANWLNGWLAAVGTTILNGGLRLHWTEEPTPIAILSTASGDPAEVLLASWPSHDVINDLPVAEHWRGMQPMGRRVSVDDFVSRTRQARRHPHCWSLSSTMTDLSIEESGEVAHSPFDPPGPGPMKWLHHRLLVAHSHVSAPGPWIRATLAGHGTRVKRSGLGFDISRLGSLADHTDAWIDPVVEVFAFYGLALFPVRGIGSDARLGRASRRAAMPRGWIRGRKSPKEPQFSWPAWHQPLDHAGIDALFDIWIDALFDIWQPRVRASWPLFGIHAGWHSVAYRPRAKSDPTRAFGAERL